MNCSEAPSVVILPQIKQTTTRTSNMAAAQTVSFPQDLIPESSTSAEYDYLIKTVIVGESAVGKSCMLLKFADNTFSEMFLSTIGVDFKFKSVKLNVNNTEKIAKLQVWDTAGQERFRTITSSFYRGAHAIVIAFDVTDKVSFHRVSSWIQDISRYANLDLVTLLLVGTKCDLINHRQVPSETAKQFADEHGMTYVETSSRTGQGINEAFFTIAQKTVHKMVNKQIATSNSPKKPELREPRKPKPNGCCVIV